MPIRLGYESGAVLAGGTITPGLSSDLDKYDFAEWNPAAFYVSNWPGYEHGGRLRLFPVTSAVRMKNGYILDNWGGDFYERIYISPSSINAGNVLGTQSRVVTAWNAFRYGLKSLTYAEIEGDSGISVTLPFGVTLPFNIRPLREMEFVVTTTTTGPATIDAKLVLTIAGDSYDIPIVGRRIVLFPLMPQWRSPIDETITVKSWAIPSVDGGEQTGTVWGSNAVRTFEYNTVLKSAEEMQRAENLIFTGQGRFFGLPIWTEKRRLTAPAVSLSAALSFDTEGFSAEEGSLVVLWDGPDHTEIKEVLSVSAGGVVLSTILDESWGTGTIVYPLAVALLSSEVTGNRETTGVVRVPLMFECEPSATPSNIAPGTPAHTYLGDELYLTPINWSGAQPMTYSSDRKKLDYGTLKFSAFTPSGYSTYSKRHNWTLEGESEKADFRKFLGRRQGLAKPVWMPSGVEDFTIVEDATLGSSLIYVKPNGYETFVAQHAARRDIIIEMWDGTFLCRRIVASALEPQGLELQLNIAHGVDIYASAVKRISFLGWYRLASPAVTVRHLTDGVASVEAIMVTKKPGV